MSNKKDLQQTASPTDLSSDKNRIIIEQSNAVEAGAEFRVSVFNEIPDTVSLSTQCDTVPCTTYISTLDSHNEITDEDIENFLGDKSYNTYNCVPQCTHVSQVQCLPTDGINIKTPCAECGSESDNWICLTCYKVYCSRYVNQHMLEHTQNTMHPIVLSFSDISVWCYGCDDFVEHDAVSMAKNIVINAKYGSPTDGLTM